MFTGYANSPKIEVLPAIDYIKVALIGVSPDHLRAVLDFCMEVNQETGEARTVNRHGKPISVKETAYYNGMTFTIYLSGRITLEGSLHKYWNKGAHNYNDFNLEAHTRVLRDFKDRFGISPHQMQIMQLELGVNIIPPAPAEQIITNLFMHKTQPFEWKYNSDEGKYKQAEHSREILKVYDKARHYRNKGFKIEGEILRIEVKYRHAEPLKAKGIETMQDLLDHGLHNFAGVLAAKWRECIFYDPTISHRSRLLDKFNNPNYWQDLAQGNPRTFRKQRDRLKDLIAKHSQNIKGQVEKLIISKCAELARGAKMEGLYIVSKTAPPPPQRLCEVTGLNIAMQRAGSRLLSHTGLRYYFTTDKAIFHELERRYLTDRWRGESKQKRITEIAHNIRNVKYNPRHQAERIKRHPLLFDPDPYLKGANQPGRAI